MSHPYPCISQPLVTSPGSRAYNLDKAATTTYQKYPAFDLLFLKTQPCPQANSKDQIVENRNEPNSIQTTYSPSDSPRQGWLRSCYSRRLRIRPSIPLALSAPSRILRRRCSRNRIPLYQCNKKRKLHSFSSRTTKTMQRNRDDR